MRYAKGKGLSAASGGRLSAFSTSFVQVPKSVVLIGLLYAIIAASVVYLLGGGLWAMLFAFMLGGAWVITHLERHLGKSPISSEVLMATT